MASRISNKDLLEKCREWIVADPGSTALDLTIKNALITAVREINRLNPTMPMAWNRGSYDNLFTRSSASITAVTQADPGVFTGESLNTDITGHGYEDDDFVFLDGLSDDSMDELNKRFFRLQSTASTTFTLQRMDGQDDIDTTSLDEWSSGGYIYHCGLKLPATLIEPSSGNAWEQWDIGDVYGVTFDSLPTHPISEQEVVSDGRWMRPGGQPERWRYWRHDYQGFAGTEHILLFYPPTSQDYNIRVFFEKSYPDLSTWTASAYPPMPGELHDCIWRRALHIISTNAEKQRRETKDGSRLMGKIEVLYAAHWKEQAYKDELYIEEFNRKMLGTRVSSRGFTA